MKTIVVAAIGMVCVFVNVTAKADIIIGANSHNGSLEDPAVGPDYNTWAYAPLNVYAYSNATPTGWSPTTLQTQGEGGAYCANVSGNQYALMDNHTSNEIWSTTATSAALGYFEADTLYRLTADFGSNEAGG